MGTGKVLVNVAIYYMFDGFATNVQTRSYAEAQASTLIFQNRSCKKRRIKVKTLGRPP